MAGETKLESGFSGFGADGEGNNGWNSVGNLALSTDEQDGLKNTNGAEIIDFNEEKAKLEEARRLREEIAQKESLLDSVERTIPNESFRALRKQELAGEIDQARERLRELGDKTLSAVERVKGEDVKEVPLAEEVAELEVKQILNGESLETRYEQIVQEFADKSSDAAAMRRMATEVVKNDGTLLAEREHEVDSLRHSKEVLENYAKEHGIELPGMPTEIKSTDMAQYANGEDASAETPKELSEEEQQAILAEFDNRKVENEDPSVEMLVKVNRANVERTALAMDMPELLEFYDRKMAEREAANTDRAESPYVATLGDIDDSAANAGEGASSSVASEVVSEEDLADDDVYNQRRVALEADLRAMEAADGEMPQYAQLTGGDALMNILRKRAQQELGITGEDVMDDRQRKIGEKFSDEDEAKITAWAKRKMTEVERYRDLQEKLEQLEEARAKALAKAGRTEETGSTKAESKTNSNDDFYAAFGRAKDREKWLRESIDPEGTMPEEEFAMRLEQTAAAYEVWHNALADGVYEKIGEQKEKGLKGAWKALKRFAKKQTRKLAGVLAGLSVFGVVTTATGFDAEAAQPTGTLESVDSTDGGSTKPWAQSLVERVNAQRKVQTAKSVDEDAYGLGASEFADTRETLENGTEWDWSDFLSDEKETRDSFGTDATAECMNKDGAFDAELFKQSLLTRSENLAQVLASVATDEAFKQAGTADILAAFGLDEASKNELNDVLSNQDAGKDVKAALVAAMPEIMDKMEVEVSFETGWRTSENVNMPGGEYDPHTATIGEGDMYRQNDMVVTYKFGDASVTRRAYCGWQRETVKIVYTVETVEFNDNFVPYFEDVEEPVYEFVEEETPPEETPPVIVAPPEVVTPPEAVTPPEVVVPPEIVTPPEEVVDPEQPSEDEQLAEKNVQAEKELWQEGEHAGEAKKTDDVHNTVDENLKSDDMPEEGNGEVVSDEQLNAGGDQQAVIDQENADERRENTSDLTEDEAKQQAQQILEQQAAQAQADAMFQQAQQQAQPQTQEQDQPGVQQTEQAQQAVQEQVGAGSSEQVQ